MKNLTIIIFVFFVQYLFAQDYVVEERFDPENYAGDSIRFTDFSFITGWGNFINNDLSNEYIEPFGSNFFEFRYQYYLRFFKGCKFVIGSGYNFEAFKLKDDSSTLYLDSVFHEKRKLRFQNITTNLGLKFYAKKNNRTSSFLQLGVYYDFGTRSSYITWDEVNDMKFKSRIAKLKFINPNNYGVEIRLGYSQMSGFFRYRLTNRIKDIVGYGFLPLINFGIQIDVPIEEGSY